MVYLFLIIRVKNALQMNGFTCLKGIYFVLSGSGFNRGQSPVEWGEILYIYPYIQISIPISNPFWQVLRSLQQALKPLKLVITPLELALRPLQSVLRPL